MSERRGGRGLLAMRASPLIPGLLAVDRLLSPGAPVNNCRWASIQWTWDQETDPVIQQSGVAKKLEGPAAFLDIQEGRTEPQASSRKQQASSVKLDKSRFRDYKGCRKE